MEDCLVLYRSADAKPANPPEGFRCKAENIEHAEEQCLNTYPGCDILWVHWGTDFEEALDSYYGAD